MLLEDNQPADLGPVESGEEDFDLNVAPSSLRSTAMTCTMPVVSPMMDYSGVISLLQQQQVTLHQVLAGQKLLEKCQEHFETDIKQLHSDMDKLNDSSSTDSGGSHKRKRVVTRELSVSLICSLYIIMIAFF